MIGKEIDKILDAMENMDQGEQSSEKNAIVLETTKDLQTKFKTLIREFRAQHVNNPIEVIVDESLINQLAKKLIQFNSDL